MKNLQFKKMALGLTVSAMLVASMGLVACGGGSSSSSSSSDTSASQSQDAEEEEAEESEAASPDEAENTNFTEVTIENAAGDMLDGIEVKLNCDYLENKSELESVAEKIIFTGNIDAYFDYRLGALEYRTVKFETEILNDTDNFQGNAVVNYTDRETPFTRIIEHKHFYPGLETSSTVVTREYSTEFTRGDEPYYPINNAKNTALYEKYRDLSRNIPNVIFGGRLGEYKYYDMDTVILRALELAQKES